MLFDYHMHSYYSDDSSYEMEDVIKDAIALGMSEICFTDHVDYGVKQDWDEGSSSVSEVGKTTMNVNYPVYFKEIAEMKEKYKNQIAIKKGLELGVQMHTIPQFEELTQKYPMDFALLSIHQIDDLDFWTRQYQEGKTTEECYDGYYAELYNVATHFHNYSVLAHMDLMRRYVVDKEKDYFEYSKADIERILTYIIQDGKGIEVNTSSFHYKINGLTPSIEILKLYHTLGGEIITVGSDSHKKGDLGRKIVEVRQTLKDIGFKYTCTFDNMNPNFHKL